MLVTLVGVKNIEAFESKDGNTIDGIKIFIAYTDEHTYGSVTDNKYIDRKIFETFSADLQNLLDNIGCAVDVEFSPTKKVVGIRIPETKKETK